MKASPRDCEDWCPVCDVEIEFSSSERELECFGCGSMLTVDVDGDVVDGDMKTWVRLVEQKATRP